LPRPPPRPPLFSYTTLFRSQTSPASRSLLVQVLFQIVQRVRPELAEMRHPLVYFPEGSRVDPVVALLGGHARRDEAGLSQDPERSEEHTSELQSLRHLVCRL